jgi:hypothetical protein
VSGRSYAQLYQRLQDLIARGTKVADGLAGTPGAQIHDWINEAENCLLLLEDKMPTLLSDFRRIPSFEFKVDDDRKVDYDAEADDDHEVDDDREVLRSESAYRPHRTNPRTGRTEVADVLVDFKFEYHPRKNAPMFPLNM